MIRFGTLAILSFLFLTHCHYSASSQKSYDNNLIPLLSVLNNHKFYSVGGTVNFLSGKELKLKNNFGETITVSKNGIFQFPKLFTPGLSYNITIDQNPENQTCILHNGVGIISNANVFSIQIFCLTDGVIISPLNLSGNLSTLAGNGSDAFRDGTGTNTAFSVPEGIVTDGLNLYVADTGNLVIRKIEIASGKVTTISGTPLVGGYQNGPKESSLFYSPIGLLLDDNLLYISERYTERIRILDLKTGILSTFTDTIGLVQPGFMTMDDTYIYFIDPNVNTLNRIHKTRRVLEIVLSLNLNSPNGITKSGNKLIISNQQDHSVAYTTIGTWETPTLMAGITGSPGYQDGSIQTALMNQPRGLLYDSENLFFIDNANHCLRIFHPNTGTIETKGGTCQWAGFTDGPLNTGRFYYPTQMVSDGKRIYVTDNFNHSIRIVE